MPATTVKDVLDTLFSWAPAQLAAPWDNVGFQIGNLKKVVKKVAVSLDADKDLLVALEKEKFDLVITHHPVFFKPIKKLDYNDEIGQIVKTFVQTDASLISFHTNLDAAQGGVNDCLVEAYGFNASEGKPMVDGFGKWFLEEKKRSDLQAVLPCTLVGDTSKKTVSKIGICCGSGHGMISAAKQLELDCLITGELTYHDAVSCSMHGIVALLLGHKESEVLVLPRIKERLLQAFPNLNVTCIGVNS